jgi:hypothetical protein
MSTPITWDDSGKRLFETGVDHGVLYPWDPTKNSGAGGYGNGVAWNGLTGVTNSPEGAEPTDLWADNIKYATLRSAETFGATIEAYTYPDEFAECDGSAVPATGVYIGQQSRKPFGFCYRTKVGSDTDTDASNYKIHVIYGCTASPSERAYETINDSPDAITFSWEITTTPVNVTGYKPTSEIVIDVWKLDTAKKTALENALYGSSSSEATLPDPDALLALIGAGTTTTD